MENEELYRYNEDIKNNKQALQKVKGKAQSNVLISAVIIAFFLYTGIKIFIDVSTLENTYGVHIPEAEIRKAFNSEILYMIFSSIGKWGCIGFFVFLSILIFWIKIKGNLKTIKECSVLLKQ